MPRLSPRRAIWRAALLTGIFSGTFSTAVITLGAPRIGRSRALDWMEIGTVLLGADSVRADPGWINIAAGVLVHQAADLFWALVFFGFGARWTIQRSPAMLAAFGIPWAIGTSAVEYFLTLPWLQPVVPMQVPYWTALAVHLTSAAGYTVFPWIYGRVLHVKRPYFVAGRRAALALAAVVGLFFVFEMVAQADWEPRLAVLPGSEEFDRRFMQDMTVHHEVGVRMAKLSAAKATRVEVQELGRLMVANQTVEIELLADWWRRWLGETMPPVPMNERHQIAGMPSSKVMNQLSILTGAEFEDAFLPAMIAHHEAAVMMADAAWREAEDPRLRIFAESLRHAQRGQIQRMVALAERAKIN